MRVHMNEPLGSCSPGSFTRRIPSSLSQRPLADFTIRRGDEMLARRGDGSTIDGFLEVADEAGWDVVPVSDYAALPAGPSSTRSSRHSGASSTKRSGANCRQGLDAIWLALHGAMVTSEMRGSGRASSCPASGQVPGAEALPLFGVFDLHANFTPRWREHANALVAYRENPHTDARESAVRSAHASQARPRHRRDAAHAVPHRAGHLAADRHRHRRPADARPRRLWPAGSRGAIPRSGPST